jgi:hypothetical protein
VFAGSGVLLRPYYWATVTGSSNKYKEFLGGVGWYVNGSVIKLPIYLHVWPYRVSVVSVRASRHEGYIHYGDIHENQPSSLSNNYLQHFLTTRSGAGRSRLSYPYIDSEQTGCGRRGAGTH